MIENEVTYLAFPAPPGAMAIFGGGYAVGTLAPLAWLRDFPVTYWGDLDTHGFAILNAPRAPAARGIHADGHRNAPVPQVPVGNRALPHLGRLAATDFTKAAVYADLTGDVHGPKVRLEQERVRFSAIRAAIIR